MPRTSISSVTPRVRIEAACARRGKDAVVDDCIALLRGQTDLALLTSLVGEPGINYVAGREHEDVYWFRVWALRGLLWAWDPRATTYVRAALSDQSWRVREMAAKVCARYRVGNATAALVQCREDPVPRVRAAAERALIRITAAGA